jgi:DNA ligase (NAD+)
MTLNQMKSLYLKATAEYHIGTKPIMSDAQFDKLEDQIKVRAPQWAGLRQTGAPVKSKKSKIKLDRFMPSLSKIYPEQAAKWVGTCKSVFAMDKLDGSALLLKVDNGKMVQLCTRGNGIIGGDITFLLPWLKLPRNILQRGLMYLRCEAVMKDKVFDAKYANKYDNPRNLVAGILNRSMTGKPTPEEQQALKDTDIVVLGQFDNPLARSLPWLNSLGFNTVCYHSDLANPTPERLSKYLEARRKVSPYAIDGLVIADMKFSMNYRSADKPKDIIAFKINAEVETVEAKVKRIVYQVTGHSRIIPKIEIEPVRLGGVTITFATVHNAKWMIDRRIGPGAVIKIVRSGGVIPKIVGIVKGSKIQLPIIDHELKGVHFVATAQSNETKDCIAVLRIHKFMTTMGIDLLGQKTIARLITQPKFRSVVGYLQVWHSKQLVNQLTKSGLGDKTAQKINTEFDKAFQGKKISMKKLMVASQVFDAGIGERKLSQLEADGISMQLLLDKLTRKSLIGVHRILLDVHGFSDKTVYLVTEGLEKFCRILPMYKRYLLVDGLLPAKKVVSGKLTGQFLSWTGYRSQEEEAAVEAAGGQVVPYGKKTTILLVNENGKSSSKVIHAISSGKKVFHFKALKL